MSLVYILIGIIVGVAGGFLLVYRFREKDLLKRMQDSIDLLKR